jgi:hypothetical protein
MTNIFSTLLGQQTGGLLGNPQAAAGGAPSPQAVQTSGQTSNSLFKNPAFLNALNSFGQSLVRGSQQGQSVGASIAQGLGQAGQSFAQAQQQQQQQQANLAKERLSQLLVASNIKRNLANAQRITSEVERGSVGGATGELIDRINNDRQKQGQEPLTTEQGLFLLQRGFRDGTFLNKDGSVAPLEGATDAVGLRKFAEKEATIKAEKQTEALFNLPEVESLAQSTIQQIDELLQSEGLSAAVGAKGLTGGLLFGQVLPGTESANFTTRLDQLKGTAFLQAIEKLKGGGQITEIEGQKATGAVARLSRDQTEEEFKNSLNDFKSVIEKALVNSRKKAGLKANDNVFLTLPAGARQIGTSNGKPVYETPDGRRFLAE